MTSGSFLSSYFTIHDLTYPDMKHNWTDGTKKRWSPLFVHVIVLLVLTRSSWNTLFRILHGLYVFYFKDEVPHLVLRL